jgi:Rod binding domain-containing protein
MNRVQSQTSGTTFSLGDTKTPSRAVKAAQEFEAQLLSTLLRPLQRSFSSVPGQDSEGESDGYGDMGIQALATGLAASGGIGIAKMVEHQLGSTKVSGGQSGGSSSPEVPPRR